jgi:hypothetical protein
MKLRIVEPGFEKYEGQMGVVFFENGLSTDDVSQLDATRMSAVMQCEWESGSTMSVTQRLLDETDTPAPIVSDGAEAAKPETEKVSDKPNDSNANNEKFVSYTREELEDIADTGGIAGLREIAEPMGIKGNSIAKLIDDIFEALKEKKAE